MTDPASSDPGSPSLSPLKARRKNGSNRFSTAVSPPGRLAGHHRGGRERSGGAWISPFGRKPRLARRSPGLAKGNRGRDTRFILAAKGRSRGRTGRVAFVKTCHASPHSRRHRVPVGPPCPPHRSASQRADHPHRETAWDFGRRPCAPTVTEQTANCFSNIRAILAEGGMGIDTICHISARPTDRADLPA